MRCNYWLRTNRLRADGRAQLYLRITVPPAAARAELPTGIWLNPAEWAGHDDVAVFVGLPKGLASKYQQQLADLRGPLDDAEADARGEVRRGEAAAVTAGRIRDLSGTGHRAPATVLTVAAAIGDYLAWRYSLEGQPGHEPKTLASCRARLRHFLAWWPAAGLPLTTAAGLVTKHHARAWAEAQIGTGAATTIGKRVEAMRAVWAWHQHHGRITANPFAEVKTTRSAPKEIRWLEPDQLARLETADLEWQPEPLRRARWLFCFACYTGLAWADLTHWLRAERYTETDAQGRVWLVLRRQKTRHHGGDEVVVPLLPGARRWLATPQELRPQAGHGGAGDLPHYNTMRKDLHDVARVVGLTGVTTHVARKTFGMLLLNDGVPIETVSRLLGHSNISITQRHYARILNRKVVADLERAGLLRAPVAAVPPAPTPTAWGRPADRARLFTPEELAEFGQ